MATHSPVLALSPNDRLVLESWLVEFDQSWHADRLPARVRELPPEHPLRLPALVEMVKIDLERQWAIGRSVRVERYLQTYPELAADTVLVELLQAECRVRRQFGAPAAVADLAKRFPLPAEELRRLVAAEQAEAQSTSLRRTTPLADDTRGPGREKPASSRGRYTLTRLHREGGLGRIWVARDGDLNREVALKEIQPRQTDDPEVWGRFLKEAQVTGQLEHPNIVPVYELSCRTAEEQPFYIMRLVRGQTLRDAIAAYHRQRKEGKVDPLELPRLLNGFVSVCNALAYAHARGVVHRDLKPDNVVVGSFGEVLVLDWGLAKTVDQPEAEVEKSAVAVTAKARAEATAAGCVLGTPAYMAPEQAEGRVDQINAQTDIYGLGAILFEVLTGRAPHQGDNATELLLRIRTGETPRARAMVPSVPAALDAVCARAMAKVSAERYVSASALAQDVQRWLADEPVSAYREPLLVRLVRWGRRHKALAAGAAALLLAAVGFLAVLAVVQERARAQLVDEQARTEGQRVRAEEQRQRAETSYRLAREALEESAKKVKEDHRLQSGPMEDLRRTVLQAELHFYQKFVQLHGDEPAFQAERGRAYLRLGHATKHLAMPEEAVGVYQEAVTIFQDLVRNHPTVAEYQDELAGAHTALGILFVDLGRFAQAEQAFGNAQTIQRGLVRDHRDNPQYQFYLADSFHNLGVAYHKAGRLAEAERAHGDAVKLQLLLIAQYPERVGGKAALANSYNGLGVVYRGTNRPAEAERVYQRALELRAEVAREQPSVPEFQDSLALSHQILGNLYRDTQRLPLAVQAYRDAAATWRTLALRHPAVPRYQEERARSHATLGRLCRITQRWPEAEQAFREAVIAQKGLADQYPETTRYQTDLAVYLDALGNVLNTVGKWPEAEQAFREALRIWQHIDPKPDDHAQQARLALCRRHLGNLNRAMGKRPEAEQLLREALAVQQVLVEKHSNIRQYALDLGRTRDSLGKVVWERGRPEAALVLFTEAVATLERVLAEQPLDHDARQFLRDAHWGRAVALHHQRRSAEALRHWDRALELDRGQDPNLRLGRAHSLGFMGQLERATAEAEEVVRARDVRGEFLYHAAQVYAHSAGAAREAKQADRYAARAVELLRQAVEKGLKPADYLKQDPTFNPLRSHDDFKKLLAELEGKP